MTISARNVFRGKVTSMKSGPIHCEVVISTRNGDEIVAIVTQDAVHSLDLTVGKDAVAVVKSSWIVLLAEEQEFRFSARNQLKGRVVKVQQGANNSQVSIILPSGMLLTALITNEAADELNLGTGADVVALFKAGHVIVGVPA